LYGTTFRFLEHFGLEKPEDLPPLPEMPQEQGTGNQEQGTGNQERGTENAAADDESEAEVES
jgi:hypothetical protein